MDTDYIAAFHTICRKVLLACPDDNALAYARAGLGLRSPDEVHAQALYLLCNLPYWRHPDAKLCRAGLKHIIKALEPKGRAH